MTKNNKTIFNPISLLSIFSAIFLIYIMLALVIYKEQIFIERGIISIVEIPIIIGFGLILLFNIVSFSKLSWKFRKSGEMKISEKLTLILGGLCLLLLIGEKTMVDEIGREYLLGWETAGEWIILYIFLTVQLFYNLMILRIFLKNTSHNSRYETRFLQSLGPNCLRQLLISANVIWNRAGKNGKVKRY